ncbi:hypothetical protein V6N12_028747 [Hibiscus sabdariffa]|uniref:Hexosyltransferase n=1 Tax=Hibiscus sabdariffa TaxID=183260 RepID=A0ABR2F6S7_9ROSI
MQDSMVKMPTQNKLSGELKQNIQEFERVLSEITTDADLPRENTFKDAVVQVLNIEDLKPGYYDKAALSHLTLPVEFRVSFHSNDNAPAIHNHVSIFSHSHYLLPEIFKILEKVVVLDDDVVVQQDLSALWSLNMGGKVIGAVQICSVKMDQLRSYLVGERGHNESGICFACKLAYISAQDQIYVLDSSWVVWGLGHDYGLDIESIKKAVVLHYNGNMKPWLELGIPKYKAYWKKYLNHDDQYLSECNLQLQLQIVVGTRKRMLQLSAPANSEGNPDK